MQIKKPQKQEEIFSKGYRNSLQILKRYNLVAIKNDFCSQNLDLIDKYGGYWEAVWISAKNEPALQKCLEKLKLNPYISGPDIGQYISSIYNLGWTKASQQRNGNSLKNWAKWIEEGMRISKIPEPPGRKKIPAELIFDTISQPSDL